MESKEKAKKVAMWIGLTAQIGCYSLAKAIIPIPENAKLITKFGHKAACFVVGDLVGNYIYKTVKSVSETVIDGVDHLKEVIKNREEGSEEDDEQ